MASIVITGDPYDLDFVVRICRDKVARGLLSISPATEPADTKTPVIGDSKEVTPFADTKTPKGVRRKKS